MNKLALPFVQMRELWVNSFLTPSGCLIADRWSGGILKKKKKSSPWNQKALNSVRYYIDVAIQRVHPPVPSSASSPLEYLFVHVLLSLLYHSLCRALSFLESIYKIGSSSLWGGLGENCVSSTLGCSRQISFLSYLPSSPQNYSHRQKAHVDKEWNLFPSKYSSADIQGIFGSGHLCSLF